MSQKRGVLFVCLGNICRSPIAEAVFAHLVRQRAIADQWFTDSAGTGMTLNETDCNDYYGTPLIMTTPGGWHVGQQPDRRARNVLKRHNVQCDHRARQICEEDFSKFDYIFGMDDNNIADINELKPSGSKAVVELLGKYDPKGQTIIEDPYYESGEKGFEINFEQCMRSCAAFLDQFK